MQSGRIFCVGLGGFGEGVGDLHFGFAQDHSSLTLAFGLRLARHGVFQIRRDDHIADLHARVGEWTAAFEDRELAERLQSHGVAAAPVNSVAGLLDDPQFSARDTFVKVTHPLGFDETIYGAYVKTSVSELSVPPGPSIGQDNERVFLDLLGMPEDRYRQLVAEQVIY